MTQRSVTYLKGRFETNDIPTGSDYADLLDSYVSLESSAAQIMAGSLFAPTVSANTAYFGKVIRGAATVSATGTSQATGLRLTNDVNYVQTTGDAGRAVVLASCEAGRMQTIINTAASALLVFPSSGCNFIGTAADAGISLVANGTLIANHVSSSAYGVIRGTGV